MPPTRFSKKFGSGVEKRERRSAKGVKAPRGGAAGTGRTAVHRPEEHIMGSIKASLFISLDGVIEAPETWHFPYFNDEMGAVVGEQMAAADATLLVARATLPSISAARSWAETVRQPATGWRHPGLLLIGEGQPYRDTEVSKVLAMPVVADLPDDPAAAAVYQRGALPPRHFETGRYMRGLQAAAQSVQAHVSRGRFTLIEEAAQ
jgi:hypothetical protein